MKDLTRDHQSGMSEIKSSNNEFKYPNGKMGMLQIETLHCAVECA